MDYLDLRISGLSALAMGVVAATPAPLETVADDAVSALAPDHPSLRAMMGALMCAGAGAQHAGWTARAHEAETVQWVGLEAVHVRLQAEDGVCAMRDACAISPLALDVLTVVVDRLRAEDAEVVMVRTAEVLQAKACRRHGGDLLALQRQVGAELERLGRLHLDGSERPILTVTPIGAQSDGYVIALDANLNSLWRQSPVRRLDRRLLQFDHRANRGADVLAKKLGLYLSLSGAASRPLTRSVRALLKAVGLQPELLGKAHGGRIADRFEEAVLRLQDHELFQFKPRRPESPIVEARLKGWIKVWLNSELVVRPFARPAQPRALAAPSGR